MKTILLILVSFIAITALGSGMLLLYRTDGSALQLPPYIIQHTPFDNYFLPGIFLLLIGLINMVGVFMYMAEHHLAYKVIIAGGLSLTAWMIVQLILVPYYYLFYGICLVCGILITLISYQKMGKAAF
jgi:hypothetical protein